MAAGRVAKLGNEDSLNDLVGLGQRMKTRIEKMLVKIDDAFPAFADEKEFAPTWGHQEVLTVDEGENFARRLVVIHVFHDNTIMLSNG